MKLKVPFGIPYDKWIHLLIGLMFGIWLIPEFGFAMGFSGWLICLGIAYVVKEVVYDMIMKKGNYEVLDAVYTMIAPTVILIIHLIL